MNSETLLQNKKAKKNTQIERTLFPGHSEISSRKLR